MNTFDLFWLIPDTLGGMSIPNLHPARRDRPEAPRDAFQDDLPLLWEDGVRSIICLLNTPNLLRSYEAAGFNALLSPIPDMGVPSVPQFLEIAKFIREEIDQGNPVVVHCVGGLGRTGTILAGHLILGGTPWQEALRKVRAVRPGAVETRVQEKFLQALKPA
jgi:atypical dual specificity phosphatase